MRLKSPANVPGWTGSASSPAATTAGKALVPGSLRHMARATTRITGPSNTKPLPSSDMSAGRKKLTRIPRTTSTIA